ncbi:hypothetical protein IFM89_003591 [Coptis chinensis]|uniref:Cupin type-1 domain-containing protein n=1 Tax=Coptis chinensis TaxID=261450 RepID=A0A835I1C0_9MAGN|nr:hypothetical protein IFM89_003591 [Coptis chinensis]
MAKLSLLLCLGVCFLVLFHAQARQQPQSQSQSQGQNQCQVQNLDALEPTRRIQSEAGVTEHWDENNEQLECAGVAVTRHTIQPRGLLLPHFNNAPKLTYIIQGRGMHGAAIPGCPETFQSPQQSEQQQAERERQEYQREGGQSQQQRSLRGDQHQKIRLFRQGDIVATPVGVAHWFYNDGDSPLVMVTLLDTSNNENQLDDRRRTFYLGGNPQQQQRQKEGRFFHPHQGSQQESSSNNIFNGFDDKMLAEAFGVSTQTARRLKGENDNRGNIVRVENGLQVIRPPRRQEQQEQEQEQEQPWGENGVEESICYAKLRENLDEPSRADVYNPNAGRINRLNSRKLPILRLLRLNAERGVLYKNAIMTPLWNMNSHSVMYVTRGNARVQIVGNYQQPIYDGELRQGQLLVVPQNFAVVRRAGNQGFEWVSFKTNDNAMITPLAGKNSALRALPEGVLMNAFQISSEEARRLKYNREEKEIFAPRNEQFEGVIRTLA